MIGSANGRPISITGLGCYVPERILTNEELAKMVDTSDEWIVERTGIRERRIAAPEQAMSDLALPAAERALEQAGSTGADLDLIIMATVTPDMAFPATARAQSSCKTSRRAASSASSSAPRAPAASTSGCREAARVTSTTPRGS